MARSFAFRSAAIAQQQQNSSGSLRTQDITSMMKRILFSAINQSFPPKSQFSVKDIPDLTGQVIIVTGGNTGVGKETAKALLEHNAKVYIAARSEEKAKAAIKDLQTQTGKEAEFLLLDLADLHSIKRAAEEFTQKETQLHVLFNNGYVSFNSQQLGKLIVPPVDQLTAQQYDLQFGTNVLGHFYLTKLLLPTLLATATTAKVARVINTSSLASYGVSGINYNTLKDSPARKKLGTNNLYGQSKLGNVIFSNELSRRYAEQGIVSVSLNPGNLKTELQRHLGGFVRAILNTTLYPVPYGALTQLWAGTTEEGKSLGGKYLIPWAREGKANPAGLDPEAGKALWTWLEEQVENV
ncbi:NAD-P-binding protein [Mycena capillaripes]|nr:NAD-P-binding protein [Mycena capillaripes]